MKLRILTDKYFAIRDYVKKTNVCRTDNLVFRNSQNINGIKITDYSKITDIGHFRMDVHNANTLTEKIEVLKILYGNDDKEEYHD